MTERRVTPQSTPARHSQPITAERRARAPAAGAVRPRAREAPRARRHQPQSRVKGRRALLRCERRACTRAAAVVASLQRGGHRRLDLRPPSARVLLGGTAQRPDARRAIAQPLPPDTCVKAASVASHAGHAAVPHELPRTQTPPPRAAQQPSIGAARQHGLTGSDAARTRTASRGGLQVDHTRGRPRRLERRRALVVSRVRYLPRWPSSRGESAGKAREKTWWRVPRSTRCTQRRTATRRPSCGRAATDCARSRADWSRAWGRGSSSSCRAATTCAEWRG